MRCCSILCLAPGPEVGIGDLCLLVLLLLISLLFLLILLLPVIDLLQVELVEGVLLVLEVPKEGHREDPQVGEDEQGHVQPHGFLGLGGTERAMSPEDEDVQAVVGYEGGEDLDHIQGSVDVETLVILHFLLEVGEVGVDLLLHEVELVS